tara:strand:- start:14 stop:919 length:906 start_codon:yes stop_codon:yes gene_type:complete
MSTNGLGYETRAIIKELKSISNVLVGSVPDNIEFGQLLHTQESLDKSSTFIDTSVNVDGYNLVAITTTNNTDIRDVSYKLRNLSGSVGASEEASLLNKVVGFNKEILITNDTSESGNILIDRWLLPPAYLSAFDYNLSSIYFSDNPSDGQASSGNALSVLAHELLYDSYNSNYNRERSHSTVIALASAERTATTTSDAIDVYNHQNMYLYLQVDASAGGNMTVDILLSDEVSGDDISIFTKGTFTASKLFLISPSTLTVSATSINGSLEAIGNVVIPRKLKLKLLLVVVRIPMVLIWCYVK